MRIPLSLILTAFTLLGFAASARSQTVRIVEGRQWHPLSVDKLAAEPGSVLDFSFLHDPAEAGAYGRVVARGSHLEFEDRPGERIKFYGSNIVFTSAFLEKEEAETFMEEYVRGGYNTLRIMSYESDLVKAGADTSLEIDPAQMDKLDYLMAQAKKHGVYVKITLFISRYKNFKPGEIEGFGDKVPLRDEFKALVHIHEPALENWRIFAERLLTHRNPYTGMTWAEDPTLFLIGLINEAPFHNQFDQTPRVEALSMERFGQWRTEKAVEKDDPKTIRWFTSETSDKTYDRMASFVRGLGNESLFTFNNNQAILAQSFNRSRIEIVDTHGYWDHPRWMGTGRYVMPFRFHGRSIIDSGEMEAEWGYDEFGALYEIPRDVASVRIVDKPMAFTEYNSSYPNQYRGEIGPVFASLTALQDWDAVYRFMHARFRENITGFGAARNYDMLADPVMYLSDKLAILLFRRGDVSPAPSMIPFVINRKYLTEQEGFDRVGEGHPDQYTVLSFFTRVGTIVLEEGEEMDDGYLAYTSKQASIREARPSDAPYVHSDGDFLKELRERGIIPADHLSDELDHFVSETGEITVDLREPYFKVVTPRTEAFVMHEGTSLKGSVVSVSAREFFCTVGASALDGEALEDSGRILLLHLTDVKNTNTEFRDQAQTIWENQGEKPHLVRRGRAEIGLRLDGPITVWGCDVNGNRVEKIATRQVADTHYFTAETVKEDGLGYMVYEIIR